MKYFFLFLVLAATVIIIEAQSPTTPPRSPLDSTNWGVVYDIPETKNVTGKQNVTYFKDATADLTSPTYKYNDDAETF